MVVCLTGMPGAGKSTFALVAPELGYEVFRMGDDVRMEAERRKVTPNDDNLGRIMLELREKGGPAAIAHLCKVRIEKEAQSQFIAIDGIRNMIEFFEFKKLGSGKLIAIHASPDRRFKFLQARARPDFPATRESFEARDRRELSIGISESIALADCIVANSGSLEELKAKASELFRSIKEDSAKM